MPQAIWKGQIAFGLVNIPVVLHSAEKQFDVKFTLLDSRNETRVRYERVNELTGEEVPWDRTVKGFEYDGGNYVLMSDEDFKRAAVKASQTVAIEDFVEQDDVDLMYFDKPYYLVPGKNGERGYVLLRETLKRTKKVGISKVVIRTREYLAAVLPKENALVLMLLRFKQELRQPDELNFPAGGIKEHKISANEIKMAEMLVESMTSEWEPKKYHDEYRDALMKWIEKKAKAGGVTLPTEEETEEEEDTGKIISIAELLKQSVQAKTKRRSKTAKPTREATRKRKHA